MAFPQVSPAVKLTATLSYVPDKKCSFANEETGSGHPASLSEQKSLEQETFVLLAQSPGHTPTQMVRGRQNLWAPHLSELQRHPGPSRAPQLQAYTPCTPNPSPPRSTARSPSGPSTPPPRPPAGPQYPPGSHSGGRIRAGPGSRRRRHCCRCHPAPSPPPARPRPAFRTVPVAFGPLASGPRPPAAPIPGLAARWGTRPTTLPTTNPVERVPGPPGLEMDGRAPGWGPRPPKVQPTLRPLVTSPPPASPGTVSSPGSPGAP
ncbi:basic proline-rich protein-like [Rhinolophus ferrumequinum]|uniref:basic proline-rich protein-like n=1 Tax=Rhinolophus ferrumequinum TaxID=59479 RepID=UPI00140FA180|nr:basic proline-rich protein-like [Rhinolophus ferrumequinum]